MPNNSKWDTPVVTSDNGTYIVDGHHRWSAIYLINPTAQIVAQDLGYVPDPQIGLKQTQFGIIADTKWLKESEAGSPNVYSVTRQKFDEDVAKYINDGDSRIQDPVERAQTIADVYSTFQRNLKYPAGLDPKDQLPYIQNYLWGNVLLMREKNPFIANATTRKVMPQMPDDTADAQDRVMNNLAGVTNVETGNSGVIFTFPVISYLG